MQSINSRYDVQRNILSGIGSGAIAKTLEYPFDTIKVKLQSHPSAFNGPIDCFRRTVTSSGFFSLYRGLSSPLAGAIIENSVLFVCYGSMKKVLHMDPNPTLTSPNPMWKVLVSGGVSGVAAAFCLTPIELIKCNVQATSSYSTKQFISSVYHTQGVKGFWKGTVTCLMREIPGGMAWFGSYEYIRSRILQPLLGYESMGDMPLIYNALAGAGAGVAYWILPYPIDTLKSSVQTSTRFSSCSTFQAFKLLLGEGGIKGLYRGSLMTCGRAALSHGTLFYCYELFFSYSNSLF